jgi:predicted DNA-binding transcriptional regulator AlpA
MHESEGNRVPRQASLPPSLAPRLVSREAAAAYVCVSPNTFDEMVRDGRMPRPRLLGERRRAWDVRALDDAVDQLPLVGEDSSIDESWSDVDAAQTSALR